MQGFLKMELYLPNIESPSVEEPGSYICSLEQESIRFVFETDILKLKNSKELIPSWIDNVPLLNMRFTTNDNRSISDIFRLLSYVEFDRDKPPSKELKEEWKRKFKEDGIEVDQFIVESYKGENFICAKTIEGKFIRIKYIERTYMLRYRLASLFHLMGFKPTATTIKGIINELKEAKDLKNITINLEEVICDYGKNYDPEDEYYSNDYTTKLIATYGKYQVEDKELSKLSTRNFIYSGEFYYNDGMVLYEEDFYTKEEKVTYGKYEGTYAQDFEGLSDNFIDDVLGGEPDAYWNID
jgi:hypothetical protein